MRAINGVEFSSVKKIVLAFFSLLLPPALLAHHSPNLHFIRSEIVEITGVLTQASWQNPHTQLAVTTTGEDGNGAVWLIEGRSASQYARAGITRESFRVGDDIRIAGFPGRRNPTAIFATNVLLADGRELVTDNFVEPRWPEGRPLLLTQSKASTAVEDLPSTADSIFRIWGPDRSDHGIDGTGRTLWLDSYPLTESARTTLVNWDRIADNPYIRCGNGMPSIMDLGTPMKFVQEGDEIVLYLEEQDSVRRIQMGGGASDEEARSPFGRSDGRWDGDTLEVTTTDIDWPWFDQAGIPQSEALRLVERFTPSANGSILRYEVVATDPGTFTEPVRLSRAWVWDPSEEIRPYNCVWNRDDL
jgi:hypothetical protein